MLTIGPFFYINDRLIYNACPLDQARKQFDKLDNSYGHEKLFDDYFRTGDYIDYPRGRVVWDITNDHAIVYIDSCINKPKILMEIAETFGLGKYVVERDEHYQCKYCITDIWKE